MERRKTGRGSAPGVEDWKRNIRALGKQIDDAEAIGQALEIQAELEATIAASVQRMQQTEGYSWTEIARCTPLTRQGARARWGVSANGSRKDAA